MQNNMDFYLENFKLCEYDSDCYYNVQSWSLHNKLRMTNQTETYI